ncbi:MAG: ABC transporter permease, partial [Deltaproteobacteria bacterium]|nr:ABC transporter permease [Deltaproteobacteria bacterium]
TVGAIIVLLLVLTAIFAPVIAPHPEDVSKAHIMTRLEPPSWDHPFGTDDVGRDVLSRVIFGSRITIAIVFFSTMISAIIGIIIGMFAGYYSGLLSASVMRIADIFLSLPQIILALALAQAFGPGIPNLIMALSLSYWPLFARIVYAETMVLKNRLFVETTIAIGAKDLRILGLHILPNLLPSIIVRTTIGMGTTILVAATLGFLGVGAQPPTPEWGKMVADAREYLPDAWWFATFPGLAIFVVVMAFNMMGDGLRDIIDPKLRRSSGK